MHTPRPLVCAKTGTQYKQKFVALGDIVYKTVFVCSDAIDSLLQP
jgi:hypothetical protein